jgi:pimeloyl-ACP methyl ester carboxylesterase
MSDSDLVVVLPGILGSTLLDAHGKEIWAPSARAVLRAVRTFGDSIRKYRLPEDLGDDHPGDGIVPGRLMPDLHALPGIWTPVKGYDPLLARLERMGYRQASREQDAPPGNLLPVAYDWRLSNRYSGKRLASIVEPALERWRAQGGRHADAQLVFVCHSMGGLVARWYVEQRGGAELTRKLITLGTPYRGAAKALDQLVNGVRKGLGKLAVDLTEFARTLPSLHQLVPEYACLEHNGGWLKTGEYADATGRGIPGLSAERLADAMRFHTQLAAAEVARPASLDMTHMIVGVRQPTGTTVRITSDGDAELSDTFGGDNDYGDATVPLAGALGHRLTGDSNRIQRIADHHGDLPRNPAALDELESVLTGRTIRRRDAVGVPLRVAVPDLLLAGEPLAVDVTVDDASRHAVRITVTGESRAPETRIPRLRHGQTTAVFTDLPPGAYTVDVTGLDPSSPLAPVSSDLIIWDPTQQDPDGL